MEVVEAVVVVEVVVAVVVEEVFAADGRDGGDYRGGYEL